MSQHSYSLRNRRVERTDSGQVMANQQNVSGAGGAENVSDIIATLNALRTSVEELRQSTTDSQNDIIRLREDIQQASTASQENVQPAQEDNQVVVVANTDARIKLYDLPTFSGNIEEWPLFYANFNDTTATFRYNHRQNLMRLQKCLIGPAREAVAAMLIYPNDVPNVISELQFRFGRPDILVKHQINQLQQLPPILDNKIDKIVPFSSKVRNVVAFLKSANCQQHLANITLLEQMVSKLPQARQFDWAKHAATIQPYPTIENFSVWLSDLARIIGLMPTINTQTNRQISQPNNSRRLMHIDRTRDRASCYKCNGSHAVSQCGPFKAMNVNDRWELVKAEQLCFSCLHKGHGTSKCRSKKKCEVNGCRRYHHQLLHNGETVNETPRVTQEYSTAQPLLNCQLKHATHDLLFKMLPVYVYGPLGKREIFVMFDEGSSISIMEAEVADMIGIKGDEHPLTLQWYDNKIVTEQARKMNVEIENCTTKCRFLLKDVFTVKSLNLPEQSLMKETFEHMKDLPLSNYHRKKPVMLIGLKHAYLGATTTIVQAGNDNPLAAKTPLGWVAYGPMKSPSASSPRVLHLREYRQLHDLVNEYLTADTFGTNPAVAVLESDDEIHARSILQQTAKKVGNQYEVGLLWKACPPILPNSRPMAERRLLAVERKMKDDAEFCMRYKQEIAKYLDKGYARKLSETEIDSPHPRVWYLPHFAVHNPHKPNKMRIVFDAAASVGNVSLNSALLKGPEKAQTLIKILLQFRQGKIGVSADIREMFSQIHVRPDDQHAQRFLWRNGNTNHPIEEFVMTSLIFGAICSPCIAEHIKNKNADEFRAQYPEAASTIISKHYVDDLVASFDDANHAIRTCQQIVAINQQAGFELRNFLSNCCEVEYKLNQHTPYDHGAINMERNATTDKVLGLYWNKCEDSFEFHTKFHRVPQDVLDRSRAPTKRELLRIVMAVFDPYGMLANFLIFTKVLMQETWRYKIGWDKALPAELYKKWSAWWHEFPNIKQFKIARCYSPIMTSVGKVEVHMFVDASQVAFAAVGYVRVYHGDTIDVSFIIGKTRTAPTKLMSIPRLELQAAVLGTRLFKMIEEYLEVNITRAIFWTDSQTVLQWVNSSHRKYKAFVGHRIAEILASTSQRQWRWVPTDQNPADDGTRPSHPPRFDVNSNWLRGPKFLKRHEKCWPTLTLQPEAILPEEIKNDTLLLLQPNSTLIDFSRFSSYPKLRRVVAWVLRAAILKRFNKHTELSTRLSIGEINAAELMICKLVQRECYSKEIAELSQSGKVTTHSSLYKLSPYVDEGGVLRLSGRMDECTYLPLQARRPILMPPKHTVSTLIVQQVHEENHHQNFAITINTIRQKFWIPNLKALLKRVQKKCLTCTFDKAKPQPALMGQLPSDRVTPFVRPFSYTGVDLFGPFNVTIGRRREKRWGVIFTCLTVRAAHIELAENLSSDAFIMCLRNFINRRGTPVRIRSDNGTNFIGAQKELKGSEQLLDTDAIQSEASKYNIEWVFNCPMNPSSGGCWERLIRVVKSLLAKTLKEVAPRVSTLQSVLIEAENIINSRPLTDLPVAHDDDEPLTPNHFLLGCVNSTQTPHPVDEQVCLRKQWRIAQNLKDRIWKRWVIEYLPQLLCRTKWQEKSAPLVVGDLVIMCDVSLPRRQWQRGRITKVFPAKDGHVRVAEVKTSSGVLRRPASRLAKLMVNGESLEDSRGAGC